MREEGIINELSKKWMRKNSALLCGTDSPEGTHLKAISILLVILGSGILISLLLMLGEFIISKQLVGPNCLQDMMTKGSFKYNTAGENLPSFDEGKWPSSSGTVNMPSPALSQLSICKTMRSRTETM